MVALLVPPLRCKYELSSGEGAEAAWLTVKMVYGRAQSRAADFIFFWFEGFPVTCELC